MPDQNLNITIWDSKQSIEDKLLTISGNSTVLSIGAVYGQPNTRLVGVLTSVTIQFSPIKEVSDAEIQSSQIKLGSEG